MRWYHEVDPGWLLARRDVITATELRSCLSAYNKATEKQKDGSVLLPSFASLWLQKQSTTPVDGWSNGAAARGHIAEEYAVMDFNDNIGDGEGCHMYHWDDVIIKNGGIGWSPDGLSIPQETFKPELFVGDKHLYVDDIEYKAPLPEEFIEVKCYEASKHMKQMLTMPSKLDERWQMAGAFATVPSLKRGYLLFYSLDTDFSFGYWYERDDLKEEIDQVNKMVSLWIKNKANLDKMPPRFNRSFTEEEIYDLWKYEQSSVLRV